MNYIKEHKAGFLGTLITHAVILLLLLLYAFSTPLPLPDEEGILVNFGWSETGIGSEEPAPADMAPIRDQEEKKAETQIPAAQKKTSQPVQKEALLTQELEKTAAMESAKKKKVTVKPKDLEKEKIPQAKQQQDQIEKKRLADAEKIRQAEINREKKEEQQRLALAAEEKRKLSEINTRAKNAFGGAGQGTSDSKSTGQGVTYGSGNQGSAQGTANAEKYDSGGGTGNGVSFSLEGRSAQSLPKPDYPGNEEGVVVVQVTVNKSGTVTKAVPGIRGTNTANPDLRAAAHKAALLAKFNVADNAPEFQLGTITYRFVLN